MKLGLFNLMTLRQNPRGAAGVFADTLQMVSLAEEIGFDIAWFAEHHFTNYSVSVSPMMTAAFMAGKTSRIRLGAAVIVLPLYHPLRVAQEIAMLDLMSGGRAVIGVGSGYQRYEFERYQKSLDHKHELFMEHWSILEQVLLEGRAALKGKHIDLPETVVTVRPLQKPLPEVFVASVHPEVLKRLAGVGATPFLTAGWRGSKVLYGLRDNLVECWRKAGLAPEAMKLGVQQYIHVTDSRADALEAADCARYVGRSLATLNKPVLALKGSFVDTPAFDGEPPLETFVDNVIIGDAQHVAERLVAEIRELEPTHYSCFFQFGDLPIAKARRALERFGKEVLPLVEKEVGPLDRIGRGTSPPIAAQ
jgi:alkanesulfonate monooxygenase SsuD/methylene tetrahydromethanopterin reductase-like flavin-dependent oxidoreductase (luciferase family)